MSGTYFTTEITEAIRIIAQYSKPTSEADDDVVSIASSLRPDTVLSILSLADSLKKLSVERSDLKTKEETSQFFEKQSMISLFY